IQNAIAGVPLSSTGTWKQVVAGVKDHFTIVVLSIFGPSSYNAVGRITVVGGHEKDRI
ncbi:unnamed protein product, partial [Adineta ricciae]